MVNTGRPSHGCLTCRRRRVKCDEAKPQCQRCIKLKVDCEWKDEWSSKMRRQERWAAKKVSQRVERVQKERDFESQRAQSKSPLPTYAAALPKQYQIGPEPFAVNLFLVDYSFTAAACPFLYLVQPLYESPNAPAFLHSVVPAVALASAAKQHRRHDLMVAAHEHYGRALRRLVKGLSDPGVAQQDATLITVFLLGLYEFISADCFPNKPTPSHTHGPGRTALLRLRGRKQFDTRDGRNIFIIIYHEQLVSSLLGNGEPLEESPFWLHDACDLSPIISLQLLMHDVTSFIFRCRTALKRWKSKSALFTSLLRTGLSLIRLISSSLDLYQHERIDDNETIEHYAHFDARRVYSPSNMEHDKSPPWRMAPAVPQEVINRCSLIWWPRHVETSKVSQSLAEEHTGTPTHTSAATDDTLEEIKFYLHVTRALASTLCRAVQIHVLQSLLSILPHISASEPLPPEADSDLKGLECQWRDTIRQLSVDICKDVPSALGEVDHTGRRLTTPLSGSSFRAYLQLFPLLTALNATRDFKETQDLITEQLRYIGDVVGIGMATHMATMKAPSSHPIRKQRRSSSSTMEHEDGFRAESQDAGFAAQATHVAVPMDEHVQLKEVVIR